MVCEGRVRSEPNLAAVKRIARARPVLTDLRRAGDVLTGLSSTILLHAGPPLASAEDVIPVLRGSIVGMQIAQGRAGNEEEAWNLVASGEVALSPANDFGACSTFAAVISSDTPVFVVEDRELGLRAVAAINEGRGRALRYGATDSETLARLKWLEGEFTEIVGSAIRCLAGWDIYSAMAQALHMGDECHSRQKAASALFASAIAPALLETSFSKTEIRRVANFLARNDSFFLPLAMAAAKVALQAAEGICGASIATCMCANGRQFGIRVAGLPDRWFTAPVPPIHGRYFSGFDASQAGPVIGDSEIVETLGLGALAMAAAPAFASYAGRPVSGVIERSHTFYSIAASEHQAFTIPALEFRGAPLGIDCQLVARTGLAPIFSTGIAHAEIGVGQIGAGVGSAPLTCFAAAAEALALDRSEKNPRRMTSPQSA